MKKLNVVLLAFFLIVTLPGYAQEKDKIMEKRAKDMHEVLKSSDKKGWEKFIKENYSDRLLQKYDVSRHMEMFGKLHGDFGDSKIVSLKAANDKFLMVIERNSDGHKVTFELIPSKEKPYKIDGVGIEAGEVQGK